MQPLDRSHRNCLLSRRHPLIFLWLVITSEVCFFPEPGIYPYRQVHLPRLSMACYSITGSLLSDDIPCNASQPESHCCSPTDICLDNHYCMTVGGESPNVVGRGSCTDISFQSKYCPYMCNDVDPGFLYMTSFGPPATYCCGKPVSDDGTCPLATHNSNKPFTIAPGSIIVNRTSGTLWQSDLVPLSSIPSAVVSTATVLTTAFATTTVTAEAVASHAAATVGGAVGACLGLPLLLALAAIFILRRSLKRKERVFFEEKQGLLQRLHVEEAETPPGATQTRQVPFIELDGHRPHELS